MWLIQVLFYLFVIKPYVYFNAMAYIASRKLAWEKKAREAELSNQRDATVDFPNNNNSASEDSMDRDLVAAASDQGQSYGMQSAEPTALPTY